MRKVIILFVAVVLGCNSTKNPVAPVSGRVVYEDGVAVPTGTKVIFRPEDGGAGPATGITSQDGGFVVKHRNGASGAEVGKYTVVLSHPDGRESDKIEFYKTMPAHYYDTGVPIEVTKGMGSVEIVIDRRKKK